jgi:GntR family transcriptional regulator
MIETRPVHEQLLAICQRDLAAGRWRIGDQFPSERELAAAHGISRATANKVLAKLSSEGWLELRKGLGMYVAERPTLWASLQRMDSFTEFAAEQGFVAETEVLRFERGTAGPPARLLPVRIADGRWIYVERLRKADGQGVIFERRWLPVARYPRLAASMLAGSFYELSRVRYGLVVERQEAAIHAVMPPPHPQLGWDCPALCVRGCGYDGAGDLLWAQELFYRGDRFTLSHHMACSAAAPELGMRLGRNSAVDRGNLT